MSFKEGSGTKHGRACIFSMVGIYFRRKEDAQKDAVWNVTSANIVTYDSMLEQGTIGWLMIVEGSLRYSLAQSVPVLLPLPNASLIITNPLVLSRCSLSLSCQDLG